MHEVVNLEIQAKRWMQAFEPLIKISILFILLYCENIEIAMVIVLFNPFLPNVSVLYSLTTVENQTFSNL